MKLLLLTLITATLAAQTTGKVISLQYIKPDRAAMIAKAFGDGGRVRPEYRDDWAKIILSGPAELLDLVDREIKKVDVPEVPAQNIECTFYILAAGDGTLPDDLAGVAKQVKALLNINSLRLIDSIQVRTREGRNAEASGVMGRSTERPNLYQLRIGEITAQGNDKARTIRMTNLNFGSKIASGNNYLDTGFNTNVDFREGQKIVIGKSSLDISGTPYFVVVTGRVTD
jgi:hypothetical protein